MKHSFYVIAFSLSELFMKYMANKKERNVKGGTLSYGKFLKCVMATSYAPPPSLNVLND